MDPTGTVPDRVSVPEAARLLGITERAVRKRIQAGTLRAERIDGRWTVAIDAAPASDVRVGRPEQPRRADSDVEAPSREPEPPVPVDVVPAHHASDLLKMVRDLQQQNLELAGQVGFLQARLASTQEQLLLAEQEPEPEDSEEPEPIFRTSFIDRLFGRR